MAGEFGGAVDDDDDVYVDVGVVVQVNVGGVEGNEKGMIAGNVVVVAENVDGVVRGNVEGWGGSC